jgi:UPF0716 protein FxsA
MHMGIFLLFIGLPLLELAILIKLGQSIGFWSTFGIIVLTGILGVLVLQTQGFTVMRKMSEAAARGETGLNAMHDGAFLALAGVLLISPGIICDIVGLALLIPPLRSLIARASAKAMGNSIHVETVSTGGRRTTWSSTSDPQGEPTGSRRATGFPGTQRPGTGGPFATGPVIDGEYEHVDPKTGDPKRTKPSDKQLGP